MNLCIRVVANVLVMFPTYGTLKIIDEKSQRYQHFTPYPCTIISFTAAKGIMTKTHTKISDSSSGNTTDFRSSFNNRNNRTEG